MRDGISTGYMHKAYRVVPIARKQEVKDDFVRACAKNKALRSGEPNPPNPPSPPVSGGGASLVEVVIWMLMCLLLIGMMAMVLTRH